jgi:hypothetical protein
LASKLFDRPSWYLFGIDDWYDNGANGELSKLSRQYQFDAVIVEYVFMSRAFGCFEETVLKVIDTHDVMTERWRIFKNSGRAPTWFSSTAGEEAKGLNRADVALAIQDSERDVLERITSASVITYGHLTPIENFFQEHAFRQRSTLIFVGSDNEINVHGVRHFLERIYPQVRQRLPSVELLLAGRIGERLPDIDGARKLGRVDSIGEAYALGNVAINPVQYGTGLNIKSIEALGYGMPLICAPAGARGLEHGAGKAYLLAQNDEQFADAVVGLLLNPELAGQFSKAACIFAKAWNELQLEGLFRALRGGNKSTAYPDGTKSKRHE